MSEDLENKVKKVKPPRTVARRLKALEQLPPIMLRSIVEDIKTPVIVYRGRSGDYEVAYANPEAIARAGYVFEEILRFNDATLNTGAQKSKIDKVFSMCERVGWKNPDLEFSITAEDGQELLLDAHLIHEKVDHVNYWTAVTEISKYDPKSLKGRVKKMWRKCMTAFERDIDYVRSPERITAEFLGEHTKRAALASTKNLVIDFGRVASVDEANDYHAYKILSGFSKTYPGRLFIINVNADLYKQLKDFNIPVETLYRSRQPQISFSPA